MLIVPNTLRIRRVWGTITSECPVVEVSPKLADLPSSLVGASPSLVGVAPDLVELGCTDSTV